MRCLFILLSDEAFLHIGRVEHAGLPQRDMFESVGDGMVARVIDHFFGAPDSERCLFGDLGGEFHHVFHHIVVGCEGFVDEADAPRFFSAESSASISEFAHEALRNQMRQTRKSSDIGGHADIDLLDAEEGVLGAVAHITRARKIDTAADARAMHGHQDRHARLVEARERMLQFGDRPHHSDAPVEAARAADRIIFIVIADAAKDRKINSGAEMLARARYDNDPRARVVVDVMDDLRQLIPEIRDHRIELLRPVEPDMRDIVSDIDLKTFMSFDLALFELWRAGHDYFPYFCVAYTIADRKPLGNCRKDGFI